MSPNLTRSGEISWNYETYVIIGETPSAQQAWGIKQGREPVPKHDRDEAQGENVIAKMLIYLATLNSTEPCPRSNQVTWARRMITTICMAHKGKSDEQLIQAKGLHCIFGLAVWGYKTHF